MHGEGRSNTLSYNQFGRGVPSMNNVRGLDDAMFNFDPALQKKQQQRLSKDQSRLDRVLQAYREIKRQLGNDDSRKLEHYMQNFRNVDKEIERMERWVAAPKPQVPADGLAFNASVKDPAAFIRTIYNLIYLAFETDSTRYESCMLQSVNSSKWDEIPIALGLGGTHHLLAHNAVQGGVHVKKIGKYDNFRADLLAEFITKLAAPPKGEGNMLDNTVVLYDSSNSQTHVNTDYPLVLVGGKKLGLKQGALHNFGQKAPPLSNFHLTLLNALEVPATQVSGSSRSISEIMA